MDDPALSPAQRRVVAELMAWGRPRPVFDEGLSGELRAMLDDELAAAAAGLADEPLWVKKSQLAQVHACEAHYLAHDDDPFAWNPRTAYGIVVHRAVELSVSAKGDAAPLDLVDHAIESLTADEHRTSPRPWLLAASPLELSELRGRANETLVKFLECWPPLRPSWSPRAETGIRAELCGGRIVLAGKVDLVLGQPRGCEARGLIVDLKTGRSHPTHLDDLRYYALVQTLRVGVPPFRVASYYLDTATFHYEDVSPEGLAIAAARTIDGVRKIVDLRQHRRPATITPGPTCGYCSSRHTCDGARVYEDSR